MARRNLQPVWHQLLSIAVAAVLRPVTDIAKNDLTCLDIFFHKPIFGKEACRCNFLSRDGFASKFVFYDVSFFKSSSSFTRPKRVLHKNPALIAKPERDCPKSSTQT
jgi:hypothetical protein